ncbi:hypothetical protein PMIN06_006741 [Paraphaeosphaeria minitans]
MSTVDNVFEHSRFVAARLLQHRFPSPPLPATDRRKSTKQNTQQPSQLKATQPVSYHAADTNDHQHISPVDKKGVAMEVLQLSVQAKLLRHRWRHLQILLP